MFRDGWMGADRMQMYLYPRAPRKVSGKFLSFSPSNMLISLAYFIETESRQNNVRFPVSASVAAASWYVLTHSIYTHECMTNCHWVELACDRAECCEMSRYTRMVRSIDRSNYPGIRDLDASCLNQTQYGVSYISPDQRTPSDRRTRRTWTFRRTNLVAATKCKRTAIFTRRLA